MIINKLKRGQVQMYVYGNDFEGDEVSWMKLDLFD